VATYKIFDWADEFRIEIVGRFTSDGVPEVRRSWEQALKDMASRRLSVDISRLSGYDPSGRRLLAEMYRHGTDFAARTPSSLVFLSEIANTPRTVGTLVASPAPKPQKRVAETPLRAFAAGQ
jgi:ABC-type transporter Mla MlaB component